MEKELVNNNNQIHCEFNLIEMPARDAIHDALITALIKDGWTITHDPYFVKVGSKKGFVDLAANKIIAATKENRKIAVEGKGFTGPSELTEFERALGQYNLYVLAIKEKEPERILFLAMPDDFYRDFMEEPFFLKVIQLYSLKIIIFNVLEEKITSWINE